MGGFSFKGQHLKARQWGILVTVMFMFFFAPSFGSMAPTLALYPDAFGISPAQVSWLMAVCQPLQMVAGLLVGTLVGNKVSYRTCAIGATAIYTIAGSLPFFWRTIPWAALLTVRFFYGFGVGCFSPLVQSVVTHMFRNENVRTAWVGIINVIFNIGAASSSMICGALALDRVWQRAYLFDLFCIIPLILSIIFMFDKDIITDEDRAEQERKRKEKKAKRWEKGDIPALTICFIALFALTTVITGGFRDYMTIAMGMVGINSLLVGTIFSFMSVVSIVGAAISAFSWKAFKMWNLPLEFVLLFLGYLCCMWGIFGGGALAFFLAAGLMGLGRALGSVCMPMALSVTVLPSALTLAIGLQEVARNLGAMLSAPWINAVAALFNDSAKTEITGFLILAVVGFVCAMIAASRITKRMKAKELQEASEARVNEEAENEGVGA